MNPYSLVDAQQFSGVMRSLVAEWGVEHFKILLPKSWVEFSDSCFARSDFHYETENTIVIIVGTGDAIFRREFPIASTQCSNN